MDNHILIKLGSIIATMELMVSCVKDSPCEDERIDCDFYVTSVTPTSAILRVDAGEQYESWALDIWPDNSYLSESLPDMTHIDVAKLIEGQPTLISVPQGSVVCFFDGLKPNTTYYPVVRIRNPWTYTDGPCSPEFLYDTGQPFTTPSSGDYSNIVGQIYPELVCYAFGHADVRIKLPIGFSLEGTPELKVASSPDMADAKTYRLSLDDPYSIYHNGWLATVEIPKEGSYYLELVSKMTLSVPSGILPDDVIYDWNGEEVSVGISKPLEISNKDSAVEAVTCGLVDYNKSLAPYGSDDCKDFTVVKIKMPSNVEFYNYWSNGREPAQLIATSVSNPDKQEEAYRNYHNEFPYDHTSGFLTDPEDYIFFFNRLDKGKYRLHLNGCVVYITLPNHRGEFKLFDIPIEVENVLDLTHE